MDKMRKLQQLLLKIPKGKVTSYKEIATKLGIHPKAAGRLLSRNPSPDKYPCYKVVCSDGKLGGYGKGVKEKTKRLKKDGIEIRNGRIGKRFFTHL